MQISEIESFALDKIFGGDEEAVEVLRNVDLAEVVERKETGVGFFAKILLRGNLSPQLEKRQWDWNFSHRKLMHGGSFIAFLEMPNVIELEGVVHSGAWPTIFDPQDFSEMEA